MISNSFKTKLKNIRRRADAPEFGFGNTTAAAGQRILNRDGTANIHRLGEPRYNAVNIYHSLVTMSWRRFNLMVFSIYLGMNMIFACMYYFIGGAEIGGMVYHTEFERFMEYFFFSAQSLTTVGYGRLNPVGMIGSTIATFESMLGLLGFALATGLLYGRFSRPTAKLLYSENIIIAPYNHPVNSLTAPTALMFRIANARKNQLIEAEAQVLFTYNEDANGKIVRRFQVLKLEIEKISYLAMTWTIVHPINEDSPLFGLSPEDLQNVDAEFMINIKAIDDTYVQTIYARSSYKWNDVLANVKFHPVILASDDGRATIDLRKLSTYDPIN